MTAAHRVEAQGLRRAFTGRRVRAAIYARIEAGDLTRHDEQQRQLAETEAALECQRDNTNASSSELAAMYERLAAITRPKSVQQ